MCSCARAGGSVGAAASSQSPALSYHDWRDLLLHAATALAAAVGADGGVLGVPQPLDSVQAGAPWPPRDALHSLLNAMYSRGARFGSDGAPALRSAVTCVRERIAAEDAAGAVEPVHASYPPPRRQQPRQQQQQGAPAGGAFQDDSHYYADEDDEAGEGGGGGGGAAEAAAEEEHMLLYGGGGGGRQPYVPVTPAGPGVNVRGLLAAGGNR